MKKYVFATVVFIMFVGSVAIRPLVKDLYYESRFNQRVGNSISAERVRTILYRGTTLSEFDSWILENCSEYGYIKMVDVRGWFGEELKTAHCELISSQRAKALKDWNKGRY